MLISNPLKKFFKNALKKAINKTSWTNMSKNGKSAYFRHVFTNNLLAGSWLVAGRRERCAACLRCPTWRG
jgi:hypothetical protein